MLHKWYRKIQNSSASGHIPGNLPPCGGSTPETGFTDFSKFFFYLDNAVCPVLDLEGMY